MKNKNRYIKNTDGNIIRLIALEVVFIIIISFRNQWILPLILLPIDFALRAFTYWPTPLVFIAKKTTKVLGLGLVPIFAPPKRFAASLGFVFSTAILILFALQFYVIAYAIGILLVLFAVLESVFNICVGCYVYSWVIAPITNRIYYKNSSN